jgi:hypothetical protein
MDAKGNGLPVHTRSPVFAAMLMFVLPRGLVFAEDSEWQPIQITEIRDALRHKECQNSEYFKVGFATSPSNLISLDFEFHPTRVTFRDQVRAVIQVRELLRTDASGVSELISTFASSQMPKGVDLYKLSNFQGAAAADGTLRGSVRVDYQKRASARVTCFKGWKKKNGVPYPKYETCLAITDVPGGHAAGIIHTVGTPKLDITGPDSANLTVNLASTYEEVERPSELVKNLVGLLTLNIGSKYMSDQYRGAVSDFRASIRSLAISVTNLAIPQQQGANMELSVGQPFFSEPSGKLELVFQANTTAPLTQSLAAEFRAHVLQAKTFFSACGTPAPSVLGASR